LCVYKPCPLWQSETIPPHRITNKNTKVRGTTCALRIPEKPLMRDIVSLDEACKRVTSYDAIIVPGGHLSTRTRIPSSISSCSCLQGTLCRRRRAGRERQRPCLDETTARRSTAGIYAVPFLHQDRTERGPERQWCCVSLQVWQAHHQARGSECEPIITLSGGTCHKPNFCDAEGAWSMPASCCRLFSKPS
jgi:hypothetical protein